MRPDVGALLLVASWLAIACASAPSDLPVATRLHPCIPPRILRTVIGPPGPVDSAGENARLVILKPLLDGSGALGVSDGPKKAWIDGAEMDTTGGSPLSSEDYPRAIRDKAQLPSADLSPGRHVIAFDIRRTEGTVEHRTLTLDALPGRRYVLVASAVNLDEPGDPALARSIGAVLFSSPMLLLTWPVLLGGAAIGEVAKSTTGARPQSPPAGCPQARAEWIEDADTGEVVAGRRP